MWQLGPILSKTSHFYHLHLHFFVAKITKFGPSQNQPRKNVVFTMVLMQVLFHPRPFSTSPNIKFGMKVNNILIFLVCSLPWLMTPTSLALFSMFFIFLIILLFIWVSQSQLFNFISSYLGPLVTYLLAFPFL